MTFYPEGTQYSIAPTKAEGILAAIQSETILESRALLCDSEKNLHFKLGEFDAIMPYTECAQGIHEGNVRDIAILTRVGTRTCFVITDFINNTAILSRAKAQYLCKQNYLDTLKSGDIIKAKITHIENFGAFCDIGCGISALLPIDSMSVSRISSPKDRFFEGQLIYCIVKKRDEKGRIVLSTKELFGTWLENASMFDIGETVLGVVRSVESYGVFIELTPNLTGLAEGSVPVECGQTVSVYIKNIQPDKMKIKLSILHTADCKMPLYDKFTKTHGHIDKWTYSPIGAPKQIESIFDE